MKKRAVYLVQHSYELNEGENETKIIGVFSSLKKAQLIINKYRTIKGFKRYQNEFHVDKYRLNENWWKDGFITIRGKSKGEVKSSGKIE